MSRCPAQVGSEEFKEAICGKEIPCLFNMMMRSVFRPLQEKWNGMRMCVTMRNSEGQHKERRVSHMVFADNCYLFAASKEEIREMVADNN